MITKRLHRLFGYMILLISALFLASCGSSGSGGGGGDTPSGSLSSSQQKAVAEAFSLSALSSAGGSANGAPRIMPAPQVKLQPAEAVPSIEKLRELMLSAANNAATAGKGATSFAPNACQPSSLVPPYNCPGGGNIYYTINLNCTMPTGCCADNNPCSSDSMSINGQGSVIYNSCKVRSSDGDSVLINGTLTATLTSSATVVCGGAVTANAKVTITGQPTITVNGVDACHGDVFVTANASYDSSISASVSGSVCGQNIYETFNNGCAVSCGNNSCCSLGTVCSTCSSPGCFKAAYTVDCCNGTACPTGTSCSGTKCTL